MIAIKKILVPTDFSEQSDAALDYAGVLAKAFGASIDVVHVFEDPLLNPVYTVELYVPFPSELRDAMLADAETQLAARLPKASSAGGGAHAQVLTGIASRTIVEY